MNIIYLSTSFWRIYT